MVTNIRDARTVPPMKRTATDKKDSTNERAEAIERILISVEAKMTSGEQRVTFGDYLKLIQLMEELKGEPRSEMTVTWVEEPIGE
jgi:hypothetical protein